MDKPLRELAEVKGIGPVKGHPHRRGIQSRIANREAFGAKRMKRKELDAKIDRAFKPREHLNRQIPPEPHTAMYVWHKYWSRKTWNVVGEFIKNYTRENDVVFDPFSGSGVTAIEAVRNKRRAIVCDLNPTAAMITDLTLRPVSLLDRHCRHLKTCLGCSEGQDRRSLHNPLR